MPDLLSALASDSRGWTPLQFAALAEQLLAAEHNALPVTVAQACLGAKGERTLQALVKANLLAYRPPSGILSSDLGIS